MKWPSPNHQAIARVGRHARPSVSQYKPVKATINRGMKWTGGKAAVATAPMAMAQTRRRQPAAAAHHDAKRRTQPTNLIRRRWTVRYEF